MTVSTRSAYPACRPTYNAATVTNATVSITPTAAVITKQYAWKQINIRWEASLKDIVIHKQLMLQYHLSGEEQKDEWNQPRHSEESE